MEIVFLEPWWLLLILAVPLVWFVPRKADDWTHAALRSLLLILTALAVAHPVIAEDDPATWQVVILDRSPSVSPTSRERAKRFVEECLEAADQRDRILLVEFGAEDPIPLREGAASKLEDRRQLPNLGGSSPISTALAAALSWIPAGSEGAVTLLSDGFATDRREGRVLPRFSERGIPLHVVPLSSDDDPRLVGFEALGELRIAESGRVHLRARGKAARLRFRVSEDGEELAVSEVMRLDGELSVVLEIDAGRKRRFAPAILSLDAEIEVLEGDNLRTADDHLFRRVALQRAPCALYLGERVRGGAAALQDLVGPILDIQEPATAAPAALDAYDLIILDDRPAESVPDAVQTQLIAAVRDAGVGLAFMGGRASFGPGGWHETPLAEILPVEAIQKEEKRDPSTTLVIIIDTSGSMGGSRVQLAKEVARLAIRRLLPHDKVGIVEFYGAKRWAAPIQPASNAIDIQRALNRLDAGGGTVIMPAIEEAFYGLQNVQTRYKHVLVLTDGGVESGAFEPLIRRMSSKGITTSTVLIGSQAHSEFLVNISNWGKGRFYNVANRFNLPEIMVKQPTSARLPAWRPGGHAVSARGGVRWWGKVATNSIPPLDGYVETKAKSGAQILLETKKGAQPILATWQWGLGRVLAFTTEATGAGTRSWRAWGDYGRALGRILDRCAAPRRSFEYRLTRSDQRLSLVASRLDDSPRRPSAQRRGRGDAGPVALHFEERAHGVFRATWIANPSDEVVVEAGVAPRGGADQILVSRSAEDLSPEQQVPEALDLDRLRSATGGERLRLDSGGKRIATAGASNGRQLRRLWPWLALLALLSYLGDLAWRRRSGGDAVGTES